MSDKTLCFDGEGTVVATKDDATGTVLNMGGLGEIRENINFYGTQAHLNPDYAGYVFKHRRKKRFKGYGLKSVQKMIKMQLEGKL